jgi:parallel beta-helix repeat protein
MGNIVNGSGAAVRTSINNTLLAYDESFYFDLPYYYGRNVKQILTFDWMGDTGVTFSGGSYNLSYYKTGDASRGFTNLAGPQTMEASWSPSVNLAAFQDGGASSSQDFICFTVYIGGTLPSSLVIGFSTAQANYAAKKFEKTISSGLATGYQFIHIAKSAFTKTGTGFDWNNLAYLKLQYTGGDATTDVYFDNLQLIRKAPGSAAPNPFQKAVSTVWEEILAVNSGEWFLGKDNGVLTCKNLSPQDDSKALLGSQQFSDFQLACELKCLANGYLYGPSWYVDTNNYFKTYIDNNQLTFSYNVNGTPGSVFTAMAISSNESVIFKIIKNGSSVFLKATKTTDLNNPYCLSADINISGGYPGICSKANQYSNIMNFAVTQLTYATLDEDGGDDYRQGQLANKQCNVRIFGAKGDGITDDTLAIQNAINYLNGLGGGTLYFPKGTYKVTSQITLYGNLIFNGCNSTLYADPSPFLQKLLYIPSIAGVSKSLTSNGTIGSYTVSVADTNGLAAGNYVLISDNSINGRHVREFLCIESLTATSVTFTTALTYNYLTADSAVIQKETPVNNLVIRDLTIRCSPTSDITYVGLFYNLMNAKLQNVQILDLRSTTEADAQTGFYIENGLNFEIKGCYLTRKSGNGQGFFISGVSNLIVADNKLSGFKFGMVVLRSEQAIIYGNQVKGCSGAVRGIKTVGCLHGIIEKNAISGGYDNGLKIEDTGRCTIKNNSIVGVTDIAMNLSNQNVNDAYECGHVIEGNVIEKCGGYGIYLAEGMSKTAINGNLIKDATTKGIYINTGCSNCMIVENTIVNPGSDGIVVNSVSCVVNNNIILNSGGVPIYNTANDVVISNNYITGWTGTSGGCRYMPGNSLIGNVFTNSDVTKYSLYCAADPIPNDGTTLMGNISLNCPYETGSLARLDAHSINYGNVFWNVGQKVLHCGGSPTTGTFMAGDKVFYRTPTANNYIGEVCTVSGTKGTLNSGNTTGTITSGTSTLTVNSATGLVIGCYITIAGVAGVKRVTAIDGTTITIDSNADATVTNAAIAYSAPTMKGFGMAQA